MKTGSMKYPNIEAERARKGITNDSLAEELGVSRKTLYSWMGKGNIPTSALINMADYFGCSIDYLQGSIMKTLSNIYYLELLCTI